MQNHFELFDLPVCFSIDLTVLERAYYEVQNQVHPDKFSVATDAEKRVAMQWATRANEAYQTLRNPLKRAAYLCELHGVDLQVESNTSMPREFLMQQMTWREALEDARADRDESALGELESQLRDARTTLIEQIATQLDSADVASAALQVRKLMFVEKFGEEITSLFDQIL